MSEYQAHGDAAVHPSFLDTVGCGACGMTLSLLGFLSQEAYTALGVISMLLGCCASGLGIYQFYRQRQKEKE